MTGLGRAKCSTTTTLPGAKKRSVLLRIFRAGRPMPSARTSNQNAQILNERRGPRLPTSASLY